jgi:hypothetical protein
MVFSCVLVSRRSLARPAACRLGLDARFEGDQGIDDVRGDVTVAAHCVEMLTRLQLFEEVQDLQHQLARSAPVVVAGALARTGVLSELPPAGAHRARRYGARAPRPDAWLAQRGGGPHTSGRVRGRDNALHPRVTGLFLRRGAA